MNNDALETPAEREAAIVEFISSDYTEIIAELPPVQDVDSRSMAFDEAGFLSIGIERQPLAPEQVAPDSPAATVSFSGTDVAATFNPPAQTPVQQMPVQQATTQHTPMQQSAAEDFVRVTSVAPVTRPTEAPSAAPDQNIGVRQNFVDHT